MRLVAFPRRLNCGNSQINRNPYSSTDADDSGGPPVSILPTRDAAAAILLTVLCGGAITIALGGPGPHPDRVGLVAAVVSGLLASVHSVWAIGERACLATEPRLGVKAILRFAVGRVLATVIAGVLTMLIITAGVAALSRLHFCRTD